MPVSLRVSGTEDLKKVSKALKTAGVEGKGIRKEMLKAINRNTRPLRFEAKANARKILPKTGGLNKLIARSSLSTKTKLAGPNASVRIVAKKKEYIDRIDKGHVRHPLFGNRGAWYSQAVPAGWFTKAMEKGASKVRVSIIQVVDATARKLNRLP